MTAPTHGNDPQARQSEPVSIHSAILIVLGAIVSLFWGAMPEDTVLNTIATILAAVLALASTAAARNRVTPIENPRDEAGRSLIPAAME